MPKPSPEKLAAALRANLKRRKGAAAAKPAEPVAPPAQKPPQKQG